VPTYAIIVFMDTGGFGEFVESHAGSVIGVLRKMAQHVVI